MGYPVSYRSQGTPEYAPGGRGGSQMPSLPANDNWRPPANDNYRPFTPIERPPFNRPVELPPQYEGARTQIGNALKVGRIAAMVGLRGIPAASAAIAVWGILDLIDQGDDSSRALGNVPWTKGQANFPGYYISYDCGRSSDLFYSALGIPNCNPTNWTLNGKRWDVAVNAVEINSFQYGTYNPLTKWYYGPGARTWRRLSPASRVYPGQQVAGSTRPAIKPALPAWVDPFGLPINVTVPEPRPAPFWLQPYRKPNPARSETEQPIRGHPPTPQPAKPMRRKPPGSRTKEKKARPTGFHGLVRTLQAGGHTLSEFADLTEAVWKALPSKYRTKNASGLQMLGDIYGNYQHIDVNKMVVNIVTNQVVDAAIGGSSGAVDKWLKNTVSGYTGNPLGIRLGTAI